MRLGAQAMARALAVPHAPAEPLAWFTCTMPVLFYEETAVIEAMMALLRLLCSIELVNGSIKAATLTPPAQSRWA